MKNLGIKLVGIITFTVVIMAFSFPSNTLRKPRYKGYLGCIYSDSVQISVEEFNQLITKPLCIKDSNNNILKVESFEMMYAERGLYQDDEGLPIIITDYSNVECKGDTIPQRWIKSFNERTYKGDTIYFDKIQLLTNEKKLFQCRTIKVVLK